MSAAAPQGLFARLCQAHDVVPSTMELARAQAAQGAPHGTTITALQQTAGRGRHGRAWISAPGAGLWLTTVLRPPDGANLSGLTLCMGAGVLRAVHALGGREASIKWPNDIAVQGRKLAGLLTERVDGPGGVQVLVGVGLNLAQQAPPELHQQDPRAAGRYIGLEALCPKIAPTDALHGVLGGMEQAYDAWLAVGMAPTLDLFARHHALLGMHVHARNAQGHGIMGKVVGVAEDGGLQLLRAGVVVTIYAGEVTRVRPALGPITIEG